MGQRLDFLQTEAQSPSLPTPQFIGEHMTKEDLFYKPCPTNTNPFQSIDSMKEGRKLLASPHEAQHAFDNSITLPLIPPTENSRNKQSQSLPICSPGLVNEALTQFNYQILNSCDKRDKKLAPLAWTLDDDNLSMDSAVDMNSNQSESNIPKQSNHNKQLSLECAMLFCGLDLIQLQKTKFPTTAGQNASVTSASDLESEFEGDLEDVLRSCSPSESWMSLDELALSPTRSFDELDYEWWKHTDKSDSAARYFHPTLVEKRRQLRRVECLNKEKKIEQLQQKLDLLRMQTRKKPRNGGSTVSVQK